MYLEKKYISFISSRLKRFKWKSGVLANCRCPLCGDSKKNEHKARFYFYVKDHRWFVSCHNCSYSATFAKFLKRIDERLYGEYIVELLKDQQQSANTDTQFAATPRFDGNDAYQALMKLEKISQLHHTHPAKRYVDSRQIPSIYHAFFRWSPHFMEWTNGRVPGKFKKDALAHDEGRIIIPFFNTHNHFFAYTGRSLSPQAEVRYITIVLNSDELLLWGTNRLDFTKDIKVVEGPIDATFLPNTIALAGGNISTLTKLAERDTFVIVFDNEPHSKEAKYKLTRAIEQGFRVVIWPEDIKEKDINAMVLAGYSPDHIQYIIRNNIYEGVGAKLRLEQWSKR